MKLVCKNSVFTYLKYFNKNYKSQLTELTSSKILLLTNYLKFVISYEENSLT